MYEYQQVMMAKYHFGTSLNEGKFTLPSTREALYAWTGCHPIK